MRYAGYVLVIDEGVLPPRFGSGGVPNAGVSRIIRVDEGGHRKVLEELEAERAKQMEEAGRSEGVAIEGVAAWRSKRYIAIHPSNLGPDNSQVEYLFRPREGAIGSMRDGWQMVGTRALAWTNQIVEILLEGDGRRHVWRDCKADLRRAIKKQSKKLVRILMRDGNGFSDGFEEYEDLRKLAGKLRYYESIAVENRCWDETNTAGAAIYSADGEDRKAHRKELRAAGTSPDDV